MMQIPLKTTSGLLALLILGGCVSVPNGPKAMAMPGAGKTFEQFQADDTICRQYALDQNGGVTPNQAGSNSFVGSAVVGTLIGAVLGAAAGGRGHDAGAGAATGLVVGSVIGANASNQSSAATQSRYDNAYKQCMYAKGEQVPVSGHMIRQPSPTYYAPPAPQSTGSPSPPAGYIPPPPPGYLPPPAPR